MRTREVYCHHSNTSVETMLHVTRDCPLAVLAWMHIIKVEIMRNSLQRIYQIGLNLINLHYEIGWDDLRPWSNV